MRFGGATSDWGLQGWFVDCGAFPAVALLVFRFLASLHVFVLLHCFLLRFMLDFGLSLSCQISYCSYESGLLSGIPVGIWFWVVGLFSVGPNLLAAFSCTIDY